MGAAKRTRQQDSHLWLFAHTRTEYIIKQEIEIQSFIYI